jgi:hypothetical protein
MEKVTFSISEAARRKRVGMLAVYAAVWRGALSAAKDADGRWRVSADSLRSWRPRKHRSLIGEQKTGQPLRDNQLTETREVVTVGAAV